MLMLAIERSTRRPGWALFRGRECVRQSDADEDPSRAPAWLARLAETLASEGLAPASVRQLAVGLGPGSFSGIRSAIAACQGFALPGDCAVAGVSGAAALALAAMAPDGGGGPVAVVGDARRQLLWCGVYAREAVSGRLLVATGGEPRPPTHTAEDFGLAAWDDLGRLIPPGARVLSPDWDRIGPGLAARVPPTQLVAGVRLPSAADVGRLVLADPAAARSEPLPIYLHPAVESKA
jgi:tRNA threonylcarbamoyl adenosine modification protein YeaZ